MKLPASALAAVLLGSSATVRAAATATDAGRQLQKTKIDGDCDDDRRCGLCEGDCDEDSNCEGDMICRQRDDGGRVPGCKLGDDDRPDVDYCYSPNWKDEDEEEENADDENEGADDADDGNNKDVVNDGETATLDYDAASCGGPVIKRAQECGAASSKLPRNCCPGYKCRGEGAMRCEIDPNASVADVTLGVNTNNAADEGSAADDAVLGAPGEARAPTFSPSLVGLPTFTPSLAPAKITPKPTRQARETERPTIESEKKARTWTTILTKDKLARNVMKQENKFMKRVITQERDPFRFTEQPSTMPSSMPSVKPSLRPSQSPSVLPTASPSESPTFAPTKMRKEECKIEMYYERKWCWHDDTSMNYDCDRDFRFCAEAEGEWSLEMEECDNSPTTWLVLGPTIRPKDDKNLCWTRRGDNGVRLYPCDEEGKGRWEDQRFAGMCMKKPSKITPLADKSFCLTSGHEPRDGEQIKFQECDKVDNSNTHLWIMK